MTPENWQKIKAIFNEAVDLAPDEREFFLQNRNGTSAEILAEARRLLAAETESRFDKPVANVANLSPEKSAEENFVGKRIGNYQIVRELGFGGMGTVFLATREDLQKQFAVKIIKHEFSSGDMLRRFQHEREILAKLSHPNIANLLDGGTTETGLPYLVMEYVEGEELLAYAENHNLPVEEKLKIFRKICSAVAYAHGKLIVHRDLKPSNILVTKDGEPKLLDFGISKLIDEENLSEKGTATQLGMMTPNYASPEQFRGESVSTSTDVYSLGVILFEFLTAALPYQITGKRIDEVARAVIEMNPQKPSEAVSGQTDQNPMPLTGENHRATNNGQNRKSQIANRKSLRGDLDNIILKSLRKEPERRYSSVEKFSDDVRRHLEGLPVTARPDTFSYRAEKFIKRNRVSVISGALVFLALLASVIGISSQYVRAERQRKVAEQRFGQVRELANNIVFKYYDEIEKFPDSTKLRETIVTDALNYFDSLAADTNADDALKSELARAYIRIGKVQGRAYFANLGNTSGAVENYRKGISLLEPLAAQSGDAKMNSDLINAYSEFSIALKRQGNAEESDRILRKGIALNEKLLQEKPDDVALSLRLGASYVFLGDLLPVGTKADENIAAYKRSADVCEAILKRDANHIRANNIYAAASDRIVTNLRVLAGDAGEDENPNEAKRLLAEAAPMAKKNIEIVEKMLALEPNNVMNSTLRDAAYANYGEHLFTAGEYVEALKMQSAAEKNFRRTAEKDANDLEQKLILATAVASLGATNMRAGNVEQGERLFAESVKSFDELVAHDAKNFEYLQKRREIKYLYADELRLLGETKRARQIYEQAFAEIDRAAHEKDAAYGESLRGFYFSKIGDCDFADSNGANLTNDEKRKQQEAAIDAYQKASELWTQNGVQNVLGVRQNNKLEVLKRKINRLQL